MEDNSWPVETTLASRLVHGEPLGVGQPRGIRNTAGVDSIPLDSTDVKVLLDAITDAITEVYATYFGAPDAIDCERARTRVSSPPRGG